MGGAGNNGTPIYQLAQALVEMPREQRRSYLDSQNTDPEITAEVLHLAERMETRESPVNRIGEHVGRFELRSFLGAGGAGEVFAAFDPDLHREVAIKILPAEQGRLPEAQERFVREARTASALSHPNIVTVHEIIRGEANLAIVMELVKGVPLRQAPGLVASAARVRNVGLQVADALVAAHAAGIVHRDIKPDNLMLMDGDRVKVLDFGLARLIAGGNQSLQSGLPAGTLRYMSPEHYRGEPLTDKSDIFALGIVLYELAAGRHPFGDRTSLEVLHAIANDQVKPLSLAEDAPISSGLNELILQMLAKTPADRPTSAEVVEGLRKLRPADSAQIRPQSRVSTRRIVLAVAGFALVGALAWKFYPAASPPNVLEQVTRLIPENRATAGAISQDGKYIAYANFDGVFLLLRSSGETTMLKSPAGVVIDHLQWMPDGTRLIASGMHEESGKLSVWAIPVSGASHTLLREDARFATPSADGKQIAFLSSDNSAISVMDPHGSLVRSVANAAANEMFRAIAWTPNGRHLIVRRRSSSPRNKESMSDPNSSGEFHSLDSIDVQTGTLADRREAVDAWSAVVLQNSTVVFISGEKFGPNGPSGLWSLPVNPDSGKFASTLLPISTPADFGKELNYGLSTTGDGSVYMLLRRHVSESIFVADFDRQALRLANSFRLTLNDSANYLHGWTKDSRSVIFESDRNRGSYDLFKQDISQRMAEPILVSRDRNEVLPQLAPDQKTVLFASSLSLAPPYSLKRVPLEGGVPVDVPIGGPLDEFRCGSRPGSRCILRKTVGMSELVFLELDPEKGIGRELARVKWSPTFLGDWDLSPDGQVVAIPNHDPKSAKVRLVRIGSQGKDATAREREVAIPGLTNISGVNWSADATGLFVSIHTNIGRRLYFYTLDGRLNSLGAIQGWAIPSPDGRKVAFVDKIANDNVWILRQPGQ